MVEKNPWWKNVSGPFEVWNGPVGCKEDGGGCHRAQGLVGKMIIHRAVNNHDARGMVQDSERSLSLYDARRKLPALVHATPMYPLVVNRNITI